MPTERPRVLLAAPADVIRQLRPALDEVEVLAAETWDQAIGNLRRDNPCAVVVCYLFDEMRPFRLLHYLRYEWQRKTLPVILVRAVAVDFGATEDEQVREAYEALGVADFFNLADVATHNGEREALDRFRRLVMRHLPLA